MILCSYVEKKLLEEFYRFILGRNGMFVPLHRQKINWPFIFVAMLFEIL